MPKALHWLLLGLSLLGASQAASWVGWGDEGTPTHHGYGTTRDFG
jgi:hypothetical protein